MRRVMQSDHRRAQALAKFLNAVDGALMADLSRDAHMYVAGYVGAACQAVADYVTGTRPTSKPLAEVFALATVDVAEYVVSVDKSVKATALHDLADTLRQ